MSTTYHERKAAGLCPVCGRERPNQEFILCRICRLKNCENQYAKEPPNDRFGNYNRLFLGLHEWMCQQGKHCVPEYEI